MLVAQLPDSEPVMTIYGMPANKDGHRKVAPGDTFRSVCVSGPSHPPVNFTWVVNGIRQLVRRTCLSIVFLLFIIFFLLYAQPFIPETVITTTTDSSSSEVHRQPVWESRDARSELIIHVDDHIQHMGQPRLVVRCEANIYSLYRGAAQTELEIHDDGFGVVGMVTGGGGKVSPTIDQRGGANRGDPDNSALTGGAAAVFTVFTSDKCLLVRLSVAIWLVIVALV